MFYAAGNANLLNAQRTVAIVGSRDAAEDALTIARRAAHYFTNEGYVLVSGNARGVDSTAEEAAFGDGRKGDFSASSRHTR